MNVHGVRNWFRWLLLVVVFAQLVACGSGGDSASAPAITSANNTVFAEGSAGTFTFTATGTPTPTLALTGALPSGVTFTASTGVLSGTPAGGSSGTYPLTFTASNGVPPNATQNFTLAVVTAPAITSANNKVFTEGSAGTFTFTAVGTPPPTLALTGALPSGVTFNASTGVLSGTPAGGSRGTYPLTFTASNGVTPNATQHFTLAVVTASTAALLVEEAFSVVDTDNTNIANLMTAAGLTVTTSNGIPAGDLSVYAQIWDTRFNQIPLTAGDITSYTTYLAGGRTLVVIGENGGFATRNNSIVSMISSLGGGSITLTTPANAQTVLPPFTGPNAVTSITIQAADGTSAPGTGALMMQDANGIGAGIYYARGTLSSAPAGRLMVVFDVNFLGTSADVASHNLVKNMIVLP
jgi:hypothetical protein